MQDGAIWTPPTKSKNKGHCLVLSCPLDCMGQYIARNENTKIMVQGEKSGNSYRQCAWKKTSLSENLWNCNETFRAPRHLHLQDSEQGRPDGKIEHQGTSKMCKFRNSETWHGLTSLPIFRLSIYKIYIYINIYIYILYRVCLLSPGVSAPQLLPAADLPALPAKVKRYPKNIPNIPQPRITNQYRNKYLWSRKGPLPPPLFVYPIPSSGVIAGKAATWVQVALLLLYLKTIATSISCISLGLEILRDHWKVWISSILKMWTFKNCKWTELTELCPNQCGSNPFFLVSELNSKGQGCYHKLW